MSTSESSRRVTCSLGATGTSPRRTTAFANISGVISGLSDKSMSSSRSASRRFKSVLDNFEVVLLLTFGRFSYRDYSNDVCRLSMRDDNNAISEQAKRYETFLSIVETVVRYRGGLASEYRLTVFEVDPVFSEIRSAFPLVPSCCGSNCSYYLWWLRKVF